MEVPERRKKMRGKKRIGQLKKDGSGECGNLPFGEYLNLPYNIKLSVKAVFGSENTLQKGKIGDLLGNICFTKRFLGKSGMFLGNFWEVYMRKKNYKGRCKKQSLDKFTTICKTYDPIQSAYANICGYAFFFHRTLQGIIANHTYTTLSSRCIYYPLKLPS